MALMNKQVSSDKDTPNASPIHLPGNMRANPYGISPFFTITFVPIPTDYPTMLLPRLAGAARTCAAANLLSITIKHIFVRMKNVLQLLLFIAFCTLFTTQTAAQNSPRVSVQGTLKTSTGMAVDDDTYSVTFKLYTVATGGSAVWTETADVQIIGGVYSHLLGSETPLDAADFGSTLYLGVTVGGNELSPRTEMSYAPYALSVAGIANNGGSAAFDGSGNLLINNRLSVRTSESPNGVSLAIGDGDSGIDQFGDGKLAIRTNGTTRMTFLDNGKVGIGAFNDANLALAIGDGDTGIEHLGDGNLAVVTNNGQHMHIRANGRIGIGTADPRTRLHVTGGAQDISSSNANYFHFGFSQDAPTQDGSFFPGIVAFFEGGIAADGNIASAGSVNWSDARTKNILSRSDARKDLNILNNIRITDYQMIDRVQDKQDYKKVIAQEVESVFPQAVNTSRRIIPNVYEQAATTKFENGVLTVTTTKAHDFATGNEIDLITPEGRLSNIKVIAVKDAHTFSVAAEKAPGNVFVYGKYVDDFKSVDYDALSMLNVSATQELYRQIQQLQQENEALRAKNANFESRLSKVEAMLNGTESIGKR